MKRILIVDDSNFMRQMIIGILPVNMFKVVGEASTGLEALTLYKKLNPDIVTMDITMSDMDGLSAVKEIINFDSKAKIVMVSAMGQKKMVKEAIDAGVKDFILKPFSKDKILDTLRGI